MAERRLSGLEEPEQRGADHAIERAPTAVTAFVGRTLKGPVNRPVVVASFAQFQQIFGGLWQPSTLSYAVEHFFENGGRTAVIVRVVNGARPPTLTLPAGEGVLRLVAVNPGSREYLRASVDYDGIGEEERDRFNLVLQRVRSAGSELVEDQEIFRRLSITPGSDRCVEDVLLASSLARVVGPLPAQRPDRSVREPGGPAVGYVNSHCDGDDGAPLTDYDIIGSATEGTGLFALQSGPPFNFLCIPPLTRDQDVGLSTLLVAARFCRDRQALLMVDPPASWESAQQALEELRTWPFRSENAVMYFPRVMAFDRLRGRMEVFAPCGAAAGMLARADETHPVWAAGTEEPILRRGYRPTVTVSDVERIRLAQAGVNTLTAVRSGARPVVAPCTLAAGSSAAADWKYLSARRLALFVTSSIVQGTRWMLLQQNGPATWASAQAQVEAFLELLDQQGAFARGESGESYFVICDERVNTPQSIAEGKIRLLFGIAISRASDFQAWMVTHQAGASRVRPVSPNRLATSQRRLEWEIETSILRGSAVIT